MDSTAGIVCILFAGVSAVLCGILVLRLHAFLALLLAALVVGLLTPASVLERTAIEAAAVEVLARSPTEVVIATSNGKPRSGLTAADRDAGVRTGEQFVLLRVDPKTRRYRKRADLFVAELRPSADGARELAVLRQARDSPAGVADVEPSDLIVQPLALQQARKSAQGTVGGRIATGFGSTCGSVGILIALAGIIGKCLLDSGAADRIVRTMLRWFGEAGVPGALMFSGFLLGVPVFFDTVFYLMIPLGKALRLRTGRNYLLYVLTIVCGGTMAHSLVPPTPGPLFVAEALGVNLGVMIIGGTLVGLVASTSGLCFAVWANRRWDLPLRESEDFSIEHLQATLDRDESQLPPFWLAVQPVLLPVLLIAGLTTLERLPVWNSLDPAIRGLAQTVGEKNVAIALAAVVGLGILVRQRGERLGDLAASLQQALASAGVVILITAAGGAFGLVLQQTGIASLVRELPAGSPHLLCTLGFLLTTAIRTAQGSSTVAMITAVGVLGGIDVDMHPLWLALAIGAGSKPVPWMNDSGFWVITRMSGMTEREGLSYITPMTSLMGVVGLLTVLAGVTMLPNF